jgi:hypothetical protein
MRKHISFAIAAAILGLVMVSWAKSSVVATQADIVRPKVELSSPMSNRHLPIQVLNPVY